MENNQLEPDISASSPTGPRRSHAGPPAAGNQRGKMGGRGGSHVRIIFSLDRRLVEGKISFEEEEEDYQRSTRQQWW